MGWIRNKIDNYIKERAEEINSNNNQFYNQIDDPFVDCINGWRCNNIKSSSTKYLLLLHVLVKLATI